MMMIKECDKNGSEAMIITDTTTTTVMDATVANQHNDHVPDDTHHDHDTIVATNDDPKRVVILHSSHDDFSVLMDSIPRVAISVRDDMDLKRSHADHHLYNYEPVEDLIEVSGESSEVETLMGIQDGSCESLVVRHQEEQQQQQHHTPPTEKGFLQRVGKSIKRMFGCADRHVDLDEREANCHDDDDDDDGSVSGDVHSSKPAPSWITQAATASVDYNSVPFPHQHLIIDLPPALQTPLLPQIHAEDVHKKCLILDLDETLVHSSFLPVHAPDFILNLPLDPDYTDHVQSIYVCKRPGVDVFLERVTRIFEVVLFTASLSNYADPVINFLDPERRIKHRLYREDCVMLQGLYIKDLSRLGRPLDRCAIVDNSPASYLLQPHCAVAIKSWFNDPDDRELARLLPSLTVLAATDTTVPEWRTASLSQ